MIVKKENAKYLTDAQWLTLMGLINDNSRIELEMPMGEGCPVDLFYKNKSYVVNADGTYTWRDYDR